MTSTVGGPPLESVDIPVGTDPFVPAPSTVPSEPPSDDEQPSFRRGRDRRKPSTPRPPKPEKTIPELKNGVEQLYVFISVALMPVDPSCATIIANSAGPASDALIALAKENPAVRRFLGSLTATSAWGTVIAAHMPIAIAVSSHHFGPRRNADVIKLHEDDPRNVRHNGAAGGAIGKFCPDCQNPVVPGVRHRCPGGA
jgi:hypothetical protein